MAGRVPRINDNPKKPNSLLYLKKAKKACIENNYAEAYEHFVLYFESLNNPMEATTAVQTVFTKIVCKIGTVLEDTGNVEELLKCYLQSINLFPNNYLILSNLGAYMFKLGQVDIAKKYLELAVKCSKDYLPAERNLLHVKWYQVPRWHFRMMNDKSRNLAYALALTSVMNRGYKNVIDIGAGCGLLSLLAAREPHAKITAYEENKTLYNVCKDILKENRADCVELINSYSTDVTEGPEKCNLIVTEIFDVALFGERALESIFHALTILRTDIDFEIIPSSAKVYVTGVSSDEMLMKNRVINNSALKLLNIEDYCVRTVDYDPYDAEDLSEKSVTYSTDTKTVFSINFFDIQQLSTLINDENYFETITLTCKKGEIHAFAVWFDLKLTKDVTVTTNPSAPSRSKCWEQAVFYLDHPVEVEDGDEIILKASIRDGKLKFSIMDMEGMDHKCLIASKEVVGILNDKTVVDTFNAVAKKIPNNNLAVIDTSPFPLLGLLLSKYEKCSSVTHVMKDERSECDKNFFEFILKLNNIPSKWYISNDLSRITQDPNHLYFFDVLQPDGSLDNFLAKKLKETTNAITVPESIKIRVQLIHSSYLDFCNKVDDENVFDFSVAKFLNEYTGCEHPNIEELNHQTYSEALTFVLKDGKHSKEVVVNSTGVVNALYYWYEVEMYKDVAFSTSDSCYYKKYCFLLDSPVNVSKGEKFQLVLYVDCSYIKFLLNK